MNIMSDIHSIMSGYIVYIFAYTHRAQLPPSLFLPSPNFKQLSPLNSISNNQLAFSVAEEHLGINPLLKAEEMARPDRLALLSYLSLFYELFLDAEPAPPTSSDEGEMITMEGVGEVSTPVSGGGVTPRSEPSRSLSSEDRNARESKKKKRRSFFRMNSKKKLLGASPSSAER